MKFKLNIKQHDSNLTICASFPEEPRPSGLWTAVRAKLVILKLKRTFLRVNLHEINGKD